MAYNYKTELGRYRKYFQSLEPIVKKTSSRAYTSVIFSFLAVSLFGWYAVRPTIQTILYLKREIKDNIVINKQMEDKISALIEAQAYYQEVEPILPAVNEALPDNPDAIPLLIQLRNLASASGVLISAIQPSSVGLIGQDIHTKENLTSSTVSVKQQLYDVSVSVQGPFENIRSYIDGIFTMRRVISVQGMTLTPIHESRTASPSASGSSNMLQLSVRLKTYYVTN